MPNSKFRRPSLALAVLVLGAAVVGPVLVFFDSENAPAKYLLASVLVSFGYFVTERFAARILIGETNKNYVATEFALIAGGVFVVDVRLHVIARLVGTAIGTILRIRKRSGRFAFAPALANATLGSIEVCVFSVVVSALSATEHLSIALFCAWLSGLIVNQVVDLVGGILASHNPVWSDISHFVYDAVTLSAPTAGVAIAVLGPSPLGVKLVVATAGCCVALHLRSWIRHTRKASETRGHDAFFETLAEANEIGPALKVATLATKHRRISVVVAARDESGASEQVTVFSAAGTHETVTSELPEEWKGASQLAPGEIAIGDGYMLCSLGTNGVVRGLLVCEEPFDAKHSVDDAIVKRLGHHLSLWLELKADIALRTFQALHDPLTGLLNKRGLQEAWDSQTESYDRVGVFLIDLDGFKQINAHVGHLGGDEVLKEAAHRLQGAFPERALLARLGGDEFVAVLFGLRAGDPVRGVRELATNVRHTLTGPFRVEARSVQLSGTIGVALSPDHGEHMSLLLRNADLALFEAKDDQDDGVAVFASSLDVAGDGYELKAALDNNEIEVWFQPIIDMSTCRIAGFEALARWRHPSRGMVPPANFIRMAEDTGHIHQLTEQITRESCAQIDRWRNQTGLDLFVGVNYSPLCISNPRTGEMLRSALSLSNLPPSAIHIEVTESRMFKDPIRACLLLNKLKETGVRISLDDFGTGASSMQWIVEMAPNGLKIDRSFVAGMGHNPMMVSVIEVDVLLGKNHGLHVIAEGVETAAQWNQLQALGVGYAQGYLLGRPMPGSDVRRWLLEDEPHLEGIIALASSLQATSDLC